MRPMGDRHDKRTTVFSVHKTAPWITAVPTERLGHTDEMTGGTASFGRKDFPGKGVKKNLASICL